MSWIGRAAAITAVAGAAVFGGWACSDDGGGALTLEEYFAQLDEAENAFTEGGDAIFEGTSEEPTTGEIEDALTEFQDVLDDFVSELESLEAPEEAADAHDAAVTAGNAASEAYADLVDAAPDAESVEALFTGEVGTAVTDAQTAFSEACTDLQQIADDNSIEVDLACNGG
jgi:hypothetical protein